MKKVLFLVFFPSFSFAGVHVTQGDNASFGALTVTSSFTVTTSGTNNAIATTQTAEGGGAVQDDNGGSLNFKCLAFGDCVVIVSSYTDNQGGSADLLILDRNVNRNDPIIRVFKNASNSGPEMRWDSPAPNMEMVATSTDTTHGRGKWEPFANPSQSEILQVNSRCWDNSSFENIAYWEPLSIQSSVNKPGLYMRASDSNGCDSGIIVSSNTAGVNFFTLDNHTVGLTGPLNVGAGSWRLRLPSTIPVSGQMIVMGGADSTGDYPMSLGTARLTSKTAAQLAAITPAIGDTYYCSDCATVPVCVSTGTAQGAFALITNKTTACN